MQNDSSPERATGPHDTIQGLPRLARGDVATLGADGVVVIASGTCITAYRIHAHDGPLHARTAWRHEVDAPVAHLAGRGDAVVAAAGSTLWRVSREGASAMVRLDGPVASLVVTHDSAHAVTSRAGRLDGLLHEIDLARNVIVGETRLASASVRLTADATGRFVGVADGATFRTMAARTDPCASQSNANANSNANSNDAPRVDDPARPSAHDQPAPCRCHDPCAPPSTPATPSGGSGPTRQDPNPCRPGGAGVPTPEGGQIVGDGAGVTHYPPQAGPYDPFNPCGTRLFFDAHHIAVVASYLVVADREARNVAVLARHDMSMVHERTWRHGAALLVHPTEPMMLTFDRKTGVWERTWLDRIPVGAIDRMPPYLDPALISEPITFVGQPMHVMKGGRAPKTGTLKILVLPVVEAGQSFNDADLGRFQSYLRRTAYPNVRDFYRENSFNLMTDVFFDMFGVDQRPGGGPLRLSRKIADYYYPGYVGAHVDFVKNVSSLPATLVFDGRERITLDVQPMTGGRKGASFTLKFCAALFTQKHDNFPVQIRFDGTERGTIFVTRPNGATAALNLVFTAKTLDIANESEVGAKLAQLSDYLDVVIAAAEAAAGIPPRLFAKPQIRRLKQPNPGFGFLVTTLAHALASGPKLAVTSVTFAAPNNPLGIGSGFAAGAIRAGSASGTSTLRSYVDFVATLAQEDAGLDYTQRRLADDPVIDDTQPGKLVTSLFIVPEDGGPGATMTASNPIEMGVLFDSQSSVPNTAVTAGRSFTPRDGADGLDGLVDEIFTAAVDRMAPPGQHAANKDAINAFFRGYGAIVMAFIGPAKPDAAKPEAPRPEEAWNAGPSSRQDGMRAVEGPRTGRFKPFPDIQCANNWSLVFMDSPPDFAVLCHELGHAIDLGDLYQREAGYRDDLQYMGTWAIMGDHGTASHHCGYHKWQCGWIPDSRVVTVPPAQPDQTLVKEVLLVPVEYWHDNDALVGRARQVYGDDKIEVCQLIQLDIGGDADVFNLIEARQKGRADGLAPRFSQGLPSGADPALLITNCIIWWDENRYAFDGKYRTAVHPLNGPTALRNPGDHFDLAKAPELPEKGIVVTVVDRRNVDGVEVFRVKVERKNAEFIDLYFSTSDPYYKNPDIWVDWTGDNGPNGTSSTDPKNHRNYPLGQPTDQGEDVRTPDSGEELHWLVARLRNRGGVKAELVKLNFSVCEPSGGGDRGNFKVKYSMTLPEVPPTPPDKPITIPGEWRVPPDLKRHTCVMVEVADWKIPRDSDGAALASNDSWEKNNRAQKNVDVVKPKSNSPYAPMEFDFSVNNSARWPEVAYLEPDGLPYGMRLTVSPKRRRINAGETAIFKCKLELDDTVIDASCKGDHDFRIIVWRVETESATRWGGVHYKVRPRKGTTTTINGDWDSADMVEITGSVAADPGGGHVRIRLAYEGLNARWVSAPLGPGGTYAYAEHAPSGTRQVRVIALFEGNKLLSESRSPERLVKAPAMLR